MAVEGFVKTIKNIFNRTSIVTVKTLFIVWMTVTSSTVLAQAPLKVAVLDLAAALFNSDVAKNIDQQLRTETAADEQKVRTLGQEATTLNEKLQKDGSVMSDAEKRKIDEQIQEIGVQYQFLVQKVQNLLQERRQQFQQTYAPNLVQAITAVVEEGGYDFVFRSEAVLHYGDANDITARVTEKLNQQR
jgi:outer membrane protein